MYPAGRWSPPPTPTLTLTGWEWVVPPLAILVLIVLFVGLLRSACYLWSFAYVLEAARRTKRGQFSVAADLYRRALTVPLLGQERANLWALLSWVALAGGDLTGAEVAIRHGLEQKPKKEFAALLLLYCLGVWSCRSGRLGQALGVFTALERTRPQNRDARHLALLGAAAARREQGDPDGAVALAEAAASRAPARAWRLVAHVHLCRHLIAAGEVDRAEQALETARRNVRWPIDDAACGLAAAELALAQGKLNDAERLAHAQVQPGAVTLGGAQAYLVLGKVACAREDWTAARQYCHSAWESGRGSAEALWLRAEAEAQEGEDNTATLAELVAAGPDSAWGRQAAEALVERGVELPPAAAPDWDEAALADSGSPAAQEYCRGVRRRVTLGHAAAILRDLLFAIGAALVFAMLALLDPHTALHSSDLVVPAVLVGGALAAMLIVRLRGLVFGVAMRVYPL